MSMTIVMARRGNGRLGGIERVVLMRMRRCRRSKGHLGEAGRWLKRVKVLVVRRGD
jgi:hypothetical protein